MKKIKLFLAFAAIMTVLFSACKKNDKSADPTKTTLQKLQAKWNFQKEYYHDNYSGTDYRDTTIGAVGEYADFRTDGKVYYHVAGYYDTATYSLIGDDKIVTHFSYSSGSYSDTGTIESLTDAQLQIHVKEFDVAPDYYEYTDYFAK